MHDLKIKEGYKFHAKINSSREKVDIVRILGFYCTGPSVAALQIRDDILFSKNTYRLESREIHQFESLIQNIQYKHIIKYMYGGIEDYLIEEKATPEVWSVERSEATYSEHCRGVPAVSFYDALHDSKYLIDHFSEIEKEVYDFLTVRLRNSES